jgi:hypothetical protein
MDRLATMVPDAYANKAQLRTLQRRVKAWRAERVRGRMTFIGEASRATKNRWLAGAVQLPHEPEPEASDYVTATVTLLVDAECFPRLNGLTGRDATEKVERLVSTHFRRAVGEN